MSFGKPGSHLENFYFQITGPKENPEMAAKLVFLHGVMGFTANWRPIARAFEGEFQVLVFDQRGHGRSFQPAIGYGPDDYATDLEKILDELGWREVNLVGHSMGGRVALAFATRNPDRVTRLVIEDIGPQIHPYAADFVTGLLDAVPVPFASRKEAKEWFGSTFPVLFQDLKNKEALGAYLYANLTENENNEAVWRFYEPGIRESLAQGRVETRWEEIEGLSMPTLLMRGEFSKDLPREMYEQILKVNPRIKGVEIPGAGHWIHSEQTALFIEALDRFLHDRKEA
jgi:pimeloyl-ACP methyl ester carboxylesterase